MSGGIPALLALAGALLLWPARRARRVAGLTVAGRTTRSVPFPVPLPPAAVPVAAGCAAAALGAVAGTPLVAALAGLCGGAAALAWQRRRRGDADEDRLTALADALGALAAELRSGRSLVEATATAVAACADPDSGAALARALRAPPSPSPSPSPSAAGELDAALARTAAAVRLSVRTGCSLAAVVGAVEDDLRARRRQRLELRSAMAGPRASAALLAGLPVLALAMGGGVGADPWGVLTTTATGQVLLVVGVALEAAGLAWSARLVRRAAR